MASSWTPSSPALLLVERAGAKAQLCKAWPRLRVAPICCETGDGGMAGTHQRPASSSSMLHQFTSLLTDAAAQSTQGNFGPVDEIGFRVPIEVIEGAIPFEFPSGVYIRSGPNPQFGGKTKISPFGKVKHHWFEGDGMLHATYFRQGNAVSYENKYVDTKAYREKKKQGKTIRLNNIDGDQKALVLGYIFNQLRFGQPTKDTCNTSIFKHNGRLFATSDSSTPIEILPHNLESIGHWDVAKEWGRPFTAHPKVLQKTGEMIMFGFSVMKPYHKLGVISADGKRLVQTCDMDLERPMYSHEIAVTENFDIILDMPLFIDLERAMQGGELLKFDEMGTARFGIKRRLSDASSTRWFPVELHYTFHIVYSYEDGQEVIVHGCRAQRSYLAYPPPNMTKMEWFSRGIDKNLEDEKLRNPNVDGQVSERDITSGQNSMEMPKINDNYIGIKYKYAYAEELDHEASKAIGMPKYGRLVKVTILEKDSTLEFYDGGEKVFFSEPLFVPRPNSCAEDDGWIVTYAHNERSNTSEVHILNAQAFSGPPVARIKLPQRVPYGFHSTFLPSLF